MGRPDLRHTGLRGALALAASLRLLGSGGFRGGRGVDVRARAPGLVEDGRLRGGGGRRRSDPRRGVSPVRPRGGERQRVEHRRHRWQRQRRGRQQRQRRLIVVERGGKRGGRGGNGHRGVGEQPQVAAAPAAFGGWRRPRFGREPNRLRARPAARCAGGCARTHGDVGPGAAPRISSWRHSRFDLPRRVHTASCGSPRGHPVGDAPLAYRPCR
mmetsp:Transcript_26683/g.75717  ORF Transcript_26683/g.75717 Transcript_26683/m.75717 type:complete len:213 (-) Transcript_26683:56-694(-)